MRGRSQCVCIYGNCSDDGVWRRPALIVVGASTSSAAGAAAAGGRIGFVAALDIYYIIRRMTRSGDSLNLGGPGFSELLKVRDERYDSPRTDHS